MNPVLLASASALAEATPEKMAISAPTTPAGGSAFALPQSGLNVVAERLIGAKVSQQQASTAEHNHDDADPAAMQALLAMLLAQPAQTATPAAAQKQPGGEVLKMLAQAQNTGTGSSLLRWPGKEKRPRRRLSSTPPIHRHCRQSCKRYWRQ